MQKCSTKHQWNYSSASEQHCAEDVKNMVRSLMETQAIDEVGLSRLKTETYSLCNPTVIMDLRHKMKPVNRGPISYKNDVIKDAKRMIKAEELERLTVEKELESIDAQINNFQKDLAGYKVKMDRNFDDKHKNTAIKNRQCEAHRISAEDMEELLLASASYNERLLKNKQQVPSLSSVTSFSSSYMSNSNTSESNLHLFGSVGYKQQNGSYIPDDSNILLNNQSLMIKTWNIWRTFIKERKLINAAQQEPNLLKLNAEHEENMRLLKKYFSSWYDFSKKETCLKKCTSEKMQQKQKINNFLATLEEKRQKIRKKSMNNFIEIKSKSANNINKFASAYGGSQKNENENENKYDKMFSCHVRSTSFRHRFKAQQNIIAEQKSKLEEQKKIIDELRLIQLSKDSEKSEKKSQEHLSQTLKNCSTMLKPKAKYLCRSMPTAIEGVPESKRYLVPSLITQPTFLSKMTERAKERQKRWKLIQEKKRIHKEERQRCEREKEQQRLQQEKKERTFMLEEVQKMKIIEKEKERKRQQEKEQLKALNQKALEYYKTYLLRKYGLCAFKSMIVLRDRNNEIADSHYRKKLLSQHFIVWKTCVQNCVEWKISQADTFYRNLLIQSAFRRFKEIYDDYKLKMQVALDFNDFNLQRWTFIEWHHIVCLNHIESTSKMEKAKLHYERKLLIRCLHHWIKFPEVKQQEKQRELRKEFWRSKVQELLPDFRPVLSTSGFLY